MGIVRLSSACSHIGSGGSWTGFIAKSYYTSPHTALASRELFALASASSGIPMPSMARYLSPLTCGIAWDKRAGINGTYPTAVHCQEALVAQGIHLASIVNPNCRDAAASQAQQNNAIHVSSLEFMVSLFPLIG